jgi:hypothetical protein
MFIVLKAHATCTQEETQKEDTDVKGRQTDRKPDRQADRKASQTVLVFLLVYLQHAHSSPTLIRLHTACRL